MANLAATADAALAQNAGVVIDGDRGGGFVVSARRRQAGIAGSGQPGAGLPGAPVHSRASVVGAGKELDGRPSATPAGCAAHRPHLRSRSLPPFRVRPDEHRTRHKRAGRCPRRTSANTHWGFVLLMAERGNETSRTSVPRRRWWFLPVPRPRRSSMMSLTSGSSVVAVVPAITSPPSAESRRRQGSAFCLGGLRLPLENAATLR